VKVPTKKKRIDATSLPVIECTCGAKILLVPNVKQMNKAIESHIEEHTKKIEGATKKEIDTEAERVREDLTAKVLQRAGEA
jgi:hypothetical protein